MQPHIGTGDGPPTRRRSADDVSPARFSDGGSPGQLQQVERASSFPPGPSRLRDTALYGRPPSRKPIPLRQHKPSPTLPSPSIAYSPWDVRLSTIDFTDDDKGKQRSQDPDTPCDSLSPAATGSIASSAASPRDSSDEAPIRIRRVGALGISVASNSDDESNGVAAARVSSRQRSNARSKGVDRDGSSMSSGEVETADDGPLGSSADELRGSKSMRKSRGISDEHFRSIVDELAIENQELKARIRRYEAGQLPEVIKEDRVVELRYFDRLPSTQRDELSDLIARYLQQHSSTSPSFISEISPASTSHPSPPHIFASAPPVADYGFPGQLQLPIIPDRTLHRSPRKRNERERLAGPSNSGVEPQSLTGTGSGIRFGWGPKAEAGRKAKRAKLERTPSSSAPAPIEGQDEPRAKELIHVLEHLFEGSLLVQTEDSKVKKRRGSTGSQNGTNEAYLGHLLENDDLSGGWMFLNLVCTMAQIHRFNVTLPFVRAAVISLSQNLEISADGSKIRWIGPRPHSSPPSATPGSVDDLDSRPAMSRCSSSDRSLSIVSGGQTATASSSSEGATRLGSGSGEGSTEASTAATSIAPHPSEILLKATAPPSALASQYNAAPTASSEEDVIMSSATESMSPEAAALHVQLPGPHTFVPCPYRSPDGQFALVRSPDELSKGEGAGAEAGGAGAREAAAGTLVFYSDVGFCSDFSRSSTSPVAPSYTSSIRKPLGVDQEFASVEGDSLTTEPMLASLEMVDDLAVIYGAKGTVTHPMSTPGPLTRSSSAELDLFRTSTGMTNSTTTDLFTVLVKTRLPFQALDSSSRGVKRTADLAFGSAAVEENPFFQRNTRQSEMNGTTIISATTTYHNPRIVPRRPILPHLLSSDESSSEESSAPSDSPPRLVQRPPSPDYLLSLSLPFFSWAPRETGAAYRWPGDDAQQQAALDKSMAGAPISQAIAEVTTMGGKGGGAPSRQSAESAKTGGGRSVVPAESSDEGMPIDLDDSVLVRG